MRRGILVSLGVAACFAGRLAEAQRVQGTVRDSVASAPIAGAVVWLADSAGVSLTRTITDESGRFALLRPPRATVLKVVRIGFRPLDVTLSPATSGAPLDLRLAPFSAVLDTVIASTRRVCPGDKGSEQGLDLWEQARAALLASVVARDIRPARMRLISFVRTREPFRHQLTHQSVSASEVVADKSYVAARPPWSFAVYGYLTESGAEREYFAPDDETLLHPTFAGTHCLRLARADPLHAGQVGIAFDPVMEDGRDTLVDVRGVLWLDRDQPSLRSLEFRYTGLEPAARESGGEILFASMPNGVPMVHSWILRTAMIEVDEERWYGIKRRLPPRARRTNARLTGTHEVGGQVAFVQFRDGSTWHGALPRITGILTDESGSVVPGARVWMDKSADTVSTDAGGHFELPYVLPGSYVVLASDSVMAAAGVPRTARTWVVLIADGDNAIRLRWHPRAQILGMLCNGASYREGTGVLLGRVTTAEGAPVPRAKVDVWRGAVGTDTADFRQDPGGSAGDDGNFVVCGTPLYQRLRIRASGGLASAEMRLDSWKDELMTATLVVAPRPD